MSKSGRCIQTTLSHDFLAFSDHEPLGGAVVSLLRIPIYIGPWRSSQSLVGRG